MAHTSKYGMKMIKWKGELWTIKHYTDGYPRWTLESNGVSVSWLQTEENNFKTEEDFLKFLGIRKNSEIRLKV